MQGMTPARSRMLATAATAICVLAAGWAASAAAAVTAAPAPAKPKEAATPSTPKAAAQFEITGHWVSLITEDWIYRMLVAPKGDIGSIPVNAEGKKAAKAWDPGKDAASGQTCKAYGAAASSAGPAGSTSPGPTTRHCASISMRA